MRVATRIDTGLGPHEIAIGRDDLRVYVTNRKSGTLTVIDARRGAKMADVPVGKSPVAVAFSTASGAAYVVDQQGGTLAVVAGDPPVVVSSLPVGPGPSIDRSRPGGRIGLVTRPAGERSRGDRRRH